jgi:hypothetical protein
MNRVRLAMLAGVLATLGLGLGGSLAQAQYMGGYTSTAPRYSASGLGYYSGYYYAPRSASSYLAPRYYAPAPAYQAPARSTGQGQGYSTYDPSGRHDGLARPWLKPLR